MRGETFLCVGGMEAKGFMTVQIQLGDLGWGSIVSKTDVISRLYVDNGMYRYTKTAVLII